MAAWSCSGGRTSGGSPTPRARRASASADSVPAPTPDQAAVGLTAGFLAAEWTRDSDRARWVCGEATQLNGATVAPAGPTWNNCSNRIRYSVVKNADHTIPSFEAATGTKVVDFMAGFAH